MNNQEVILYKVTTDKTYTDKNGKERKSFYYVLQTAVGYVPITTKWDNANDKCILRLTATPISEEALKRANRRG